LAFSTAAFLGLLFLLAISFSFFQVDIKKESRKSDSLIHKDINKTIPKK
jgi:hypothetical protein